MRFQLYVPNSHIAEFLKFKHLQKSPSKTLLNLMVSSNNGTILLDVPTLRKTLKSSKDNIRRMRLLLEEFN